MDELREALGWLMCGEDEEGPLEGDEEEVSASRGSGGRSRGGRIRNDLR